MAATQSIACTGAHQEGALDEDSVHAASKPVGGSWSRPAGVLAEAAGRAKRAGEKKEAAGSLDKARAALLPRRTLERMYDVATAEKHSFWYINLLNERQEMFFKGFEQRMVVPTQK